MDRLTPRWMTAVLIAAGIYNIAWGVIVALFPVPLFEIAGMAPPRYPALFQCIGMMIAVFGLAYLCAASNPLRHWPVLVAGLVGRLLGPIGFLYLAINGVFTWQAGFTIVTNDLIWIIPFALMLRAAWIQERKI